MYKIGVDIGGTKITVGLFDAQSATLMKSSKTAIKDISDICTYIDKEISSLCDICKVSRADVVSCGVGIPGTVSADGKSILKAPNIAGLPEDMGLRLGKILGIPVRLAQDSRAAAYGEYIASGRKYKLLVCVTLGTGVGTGIVADGKIFDGAMGCAGELGHLPIKKNGRACGCGKRGCLEKYCAGGGLDITAAELLGKGCSAQDLFDAAANGNEKCKTVISEAVSTLGAALVSIINLLSPDCLLFSGGLSSRKTEYIDPIIEYITSHCYSAGELPCIGVASLGENSPLYGAAFLPCEALRKSLVLSASIMCADVLNFDNALKEIEDAGIEYVHCDIMDNHFVPNLMLPPELLNKLRSVSNIPFDYHLMTEKPETVVDRLLVKEGDIISVHYESTPHLEKVIDMIKAKGALAAVAINPATPISVLDQILPSLDAVLIMTVNPGFAGQKIVPFSFEKIEKMRALLAKRGLERILIEVDGNCSFENVPKMQTAGADIFVVGTSSVFKDGITVNEGVKKLRALSR